MKTPQISRVRKTHGYGAVAILMAGLCVAPAWATEPESIDANTARQLARGWSAFYNNEPNTASEAVERLTRSQQSGTRLHALHLKARSLWLTGDPASQREAQNLWNQVAREGRNDRFATARTEIARALHLAERGQDPRGQNVRGQDLRGQDFRGRGQAIEALEKVTKQQLPSAVSVEAAIELAILYAEANRPDDATAQLDAADKILEYAESIGLTNDLRNAFVRGVQQARESIQNPGRPLFLRAKGLQREGRYAQAAELFARVTREYAGSDYAERSDMDIGYCLLGLGRVPQAIAHWQRFIAADAAGAWRGQAYLGLVDARLEFELDLAAADQQLAMAVTAIPAGLANRKGGESWKQVEFDLRMRQAAISLIRNQLDHAVESLRLAVRVDSLSREKRLNVENLLGLMQTGIAPIPREIDPTSGRPSLAVALAGFHVEVEESGRASDILDRLAAGRSGRPSSDENAFAAFLRGRLLERAGSPEQSTTFYARSIQMARNGSWHDRTLYRLASLNQAQIDQRHRGVRELASNYEARTTAAPADQQQLAAYLRARTDVLEPLEQIVQRYPDSPYVEHTLRLIGGIHAEAGEWRKAGDAWQRYLRDCPQHPATGSVAVRLVDLQLERLFDLEQASTTSQLAVDWARSRRSEWHRPPPDVPTPDDAAIRQWQYAAFLRAGLVAYLNQQFDQSLAMFRESRPFFVEQRDFNVVQGHIPTGLERLMDAARDQRRLTPDIVLEGNPNARLILQLADVYLEAGQWQKVIRLCDVVIHTRQFTPSPYQKSWAHHQRAAAIYGVPDCKNARDDYLLAQQLAPNAPWAARAMFDAACITNNFHQDRPRAAREFEAVVRTYPNSDIADKAAYFIGFTYEADEQWDQAQRAYQGFLDRYPDSRWAGLVQRHHLPTVEKQIEAARSTPTRGTRR